MRFRVDEKLDKDLEHIKQDKKLLLKLKLVIDEIEHADNLFNIQHIKKIKGFKTYYRIRIGEYRLGIELEGDVLTLIRLLPRKDFYKKFP